MIWIYIVWICFRVSDPCPEEIIGCAVHHSHMECNEFDAFLNRDSAMVFLNETENRLPWDRNFNRLDSLTLEEFIKQGKTD